MIHEHENENEFEPEVELPAAFQQALRQADQGDLGVPAEVDAAVQAATKRHFRSLRRRRMLRIWMPVSGAAAAAVLFFLFSEPLPDRASQSEKSPVLVRRDGVTILDAFALARQLETREAPGREWDYNGDGTVDQRDVDALARAAVRLENET